MCARCTFRVGGKRPQFWHPDTGRTEPVAVYSTTKEEHRKSPIYFDPCGSLFVVFRPDAAVKSAERVVSLTRNGQSILPGGADGIRRQRSRSIGPSTACPATRRTAAT